MLLPVNLVLEIRTQDEYDGVQEILSSLRKKGDPTQEWWFRSDLVKELADRVTTRLTDSAKESRVLINGYPIATGTTEDMTKRYDTERGMHQRSNIVLEEWKNGGYVSVRSRRLQKL